MELAYIFSDCTARAFSKCLVTSLTLLLRNETFHACPLRVTYNYIQHPIRLCNRKLQHRPSVNVGSDYSYAN